MSYQIYNHEFIQLLSLSIIIFIQYSLFKKFTSQLNIQINNPFTYNPLRI